MPRQRGQRLLCPPSGRSKLAYFGFHPLSEEDARQRNNPRRFSSTGPYLRQSSQKECPHGSLTGLVHSPRHMPHSLTLSSIATERRDPHRHSSVMASASHGFGRNGPRCFRELVAPVLLHRNPRPLLLDLLLGFWFLCGPGGGDVRARAHATHTTAHNTSFY